MTVKKTRFKSHQVNLDLEPWVTHHGVRAAKPGEVALAWAYDPRPEFEPTRDPLPFIIHNSRGEGRRYSRREVEPLRESLSVEWAPRHDQFDTPVNRVLVSVREGLKIRAGRERELIDLWLGNLRPISNPAQGFGVTEAEVDHARKVLTRLAGWSA